MSSKAVAKDGHFHFYGQIPERPNGGDCKSLVYDFGGSNPSLPTILRFFEEKTSNGAAIRIEECHPKL